MWFSSSLHFGTNLKIYNGTYWPTEQKKASKILARLLLRVLQLGNRQTTPDICSHQNRKRALGEGTVCLAALRCDPHGGEKKMVEETLDLDEMVREELRYLNPMRWIIE